jgi:hypothetical protein
MKTRTLLLAAAAMLGSTPAFAFKQDNHVAINSSALDFLTDSVRGRLAKRTHELDKVGGKFAGVDKYHFNDCDFSGASRQIRQGYDDLLKALGAKNQAAAQDSFGNILHAVQDFYAHSNWVESGQETLVDGTLGPWTELKPWTPQGDLMFVQGSVPASTKVKRTGTEHTVTVTKDGKTYKGIVTGWVAVKMQCPVSSTFRPVGHWDVKSVGKGLHKDEPRRAGYEKARKVAAAQTQHEWCRLRTLGARYAATLDPWVKNKTAAAAICRPR